MQKQIFYTYKFKSSRLAEFNYDINLTFDQAKANKEVISMFDSQLFRSLRNIKEQVFDHEVLERLKKQLKFLKRQNHSEENLTKIKELQTKINEMLYVPEIVSIVIENKAHYRYLFRNKLKLNGLKYRRLTCSAGQARSSTVIFCETNMADKLDEIFDNGRNKDVKLVPSKFNAYKGLVTSSTSVVSTPRFCLVPDYESPTDVKVNFVTETEINKDDIIGEKTITEMFNRFDGQGIISIEMATKWAEELGLDYIPSQWCIRQNYIKGMLSTFDIKAFCEQKNNGNYIIKTSYKDENGEPILADLSKIDVIISESQFKLWKSFSSIEEYQENCNINKLDWGISLVSPKKDKDILKMNYQFLQTVKLNDSQIESLCKKTVDWLTGVTSKDINYTLLFLLGKEITEDKVLGYIKDSENHWGKALMLDNALISDKWIKRKIYDLIKKKIKRACLGEVLVDGNFQVIVSDPYAMMQHVCGQEVTGLLGKREYYANYWNQKGVKKVDSMRAPLTYRSEHVVLNLMQKEELDYWYKYNTTGIIVNVHGHETMNWAGSDFDFDIIATTSEQNIVNGVYQDELPITYTPPKSNAINFKERDLYNADLHSFGSEIGQITNKSTSGYALLAQLDEGTPEFETTLKRIQMSTKLQSAQIDKAKIGRKVKSIPNIWLKYNRVEDTDSDEVRKEKEFLNKVLLHKHPYFFTYLYKNTRRKYKKYHNNQDTTCRQLFGIGIEELKNLPRKTPEQIEFLRKYKQYSPVIDSDCTMNKICRYIESIDFGIRNVVGNEEDPEIHKRLMNNGNIILDDKKVAEILKKLNTFRKSSEEEASTNTESNRDEQNEELKRKISEAYENLKKSLLPICVNQQELVDYLIKMAYEDNGAISKEVLWSMYGEEIVENLKVKTGSVYLPFPSNSGEIEYLNNRYTMRKVELDVE
ncbi:RNA dependent RNA polymerase [Cytobacillus gottheilii]|uniref:RNA dependent RNA polymerase n=1 Tax=Cytobacillus gottheilii TaxID=859144 RepID=UPI0009BBBC8F|nr:hypothetical protein [Cytobacillus gottheilii]